jgi:hypothetical protein
VGLARDDLVLVVRKGLTFHARVLGAETMGRYRIAPLDSAIRARSAKLTEVGDHRTHQGDPRPAGGPDRAQASFDHLVDR